MEYKSYYTREVTASEKYEWADRIIMIAEDIELNYLYIKELIEPTGAMIIHVENGKDAVDYCKKDNKVDLILMDLLMPVMNGYDATRLIKDMRSKLPIIAQTAYSMSEDRKHAISAGCDDYITKPIGRDELLAKINNFFQTKD